MSLSPECRTELLELVATVRDQVATDADRDRLRALVVENREARQLYIRQLHLAASLRWSLEDQDVASEQTRSAVTSPPVPVLGFLGKVRRASSNWLTMPRLIVVAVSMSLVTYFAALVVSVLWDQAHPADWKSRHSAATLIAADDCEWNGSAPAKPGEPLATSVISLRRGTVDLSFEKGTQVTVEGPAEFEVQSANSGFLRSGRLMARVPHEAVGFAISTPDAHIVDLGTEFGVEVDSAGETSVQVLEGLVEFSSNRKQVDGGIKKSRNQRLRAGEAARTDLATSGIVSTEFKPHRFAHRPTQATNTRRHETMIDLGNATVTQSSDFAAAKCPPTGAIDGDPKTFSHTADDDSSAWWQVDLERTHSIAVVVLQNRTDSRGMLRDITIKVLGEDGRQVVASSPILNPRNSEYGENEYDAGPPQIVFDLLRAQGQAAVGRYVRIERAPSQVDESRMSTANRGKFKLWLGAFANSLILSEVQLFEVSAEAESKTPSSPQR